MKVLNPSIELNTMGLHFLKEVKNGMLLAPNCFEMEDEEEEENQACTIL